jgi:ABC-type branched-subunit amino acid transport system ATPase component
VVEICRELLKENIAILLVERNIHVAEALADRIIIILSGRTVHESDAPAFLDNIELRHRYLGV